MYPLTIILFGLFLATLTSNKRPINENKIQHLVTALFLDVTDFNKYDGKAAYPLIKPFKQEKGLENYFDLQEEKPNIVIVVVEGLGADFVGKDAKYKGFTPFIDSLSTVSLSWKNYVSNAGETHVALSSILGSLPFGSHGFTNVTASLNRQTLYGILKNLSLIHI